MHLASTILAERVDGDTLAVTLPSGEKFSQKLRILLLHSLLASLLLPDFLPLLDQGQTLAVELAPGPRGNGHRCGSDHALKDYALCINSLYSILIACIISN